MPSGLVLLADTHAHLDSPAFAEEHDAIVQRARAAGVERVLAVGSDYASSQAAVALAARYDIVYAAVGVHPHEADRFAAERAATHALLSRPKVVAVGEIGLDYRRGPAGRDIQLAAFREQVGWAIERDLAVSVHNRDADSDVLTVLSGLPRAVLHCFSSPWDTAQAALDGGHYISFAGNLTFPKAEQLREVARRVPRERLLVETDAPVLAPQPWRGRRNEPAYVSATVQVLAEVRAEPAAELAAATSDTASAVFRWTQP